MGKNDQTVKPYSTRITKYSFRMENVWPKDEEEQDWKNTFHTWEEQEEKRGNLNKQMCNRVEETARLVGAETQEQYLQSATRLYHELTIGHKPYWNHEQLWNISSIPIPQGHWFQRTENGVTCHIVALDFRVVLPYSDSVAGLVYLPNNTEQF